jgi:mono/diheme cytochrome c family protein
MLHVRHFKPSRDGSLNRRWRSHGMQARHQARQSARLSALLAFLLWGLCGTLSAAAQCQGPLASGLRSEFGPPQHFPQQGGAALYHSICQGCHMPNAKGACGAGCYPALAGDPALMAPAFAVRTVVNGLEGMPAFGPMLSDQQIADVINYVRTHFGNHYPLAVTPAQVKAARKSAAATSATCPRRGVPALFW